VTRAFAGLLATALLFAACSDITPTQRRTAEQIGCLVDGIVQPIGASALATASDIGSVALTLDTALVHPLIVEACRKLNGVPAVPTS
jgi:hypothetical protein